MPPPPCFDRQLHPARLLRAGETLILFFYAEPDTVNAFVPAATIAERLVAAQMLLTLLWALARRWRWKCTLSLT